MTQINRRKCRRSLSLSLLCSHRGIALGIGFGKDTSQLESICDSRTTYIYPLTQSMFYIVDRMHHSNKDHWFSVNFHLNIMKNIRTSLDQGWSAGRKRNDSFYKSWGLFRTLRIANRIWGISCTCSRYIRKGINLNICHWARPCLGCTGGRSLCRRRTLRSLFGCIPAFFGSHLCY